MATTQNELLHREDGRKGGGPVIADKMLFSGTMCFIDATTGFYTDIIAAGANKFGGIVEVPADNTGGADGDVTVQVFERSSFVLIGSGFTQDDVGKKIYAVDNFTVSLTSTSQTYIGTITRLHSGTQVLVALDIQLP